MDWKRLLIYALMILPWIVVSLSMLFLPDSIPAHYGFDGNVDRYGSKYELFIWPPIVTGLGILFLLVERWVRSVPTLDPKSPKQVEILSIITLLIFNVLTVCFTYLAY